jgi:hypothetical protein
VGIPEECKFATKIESGWVLIERVKTLYLLFKAVTCDDLYGRSGWFRAQMNKVILYNSYLDFNKTLNNSMMSHGLVCLGYNSRNSLSGTLIPLLVQIISKIN